MFLWDGLTSNASQQGHETMELIRQQNLPLLFQELTQAPSAQAEAIRLSLYLPHYRNSPQKRVKQAQKLVQRAYKFMATALDAKELERRMVLLNQTFERSEFLSQSPQALGYAFFLDNTHFEVQPLLLPCDPLVIVAPSFHVLPLLRSLASEPHYRLIVVNKTEGEIYRRDHDALKCELKVAFPSVQSRRPEVPFPRASSRDLDRVSHCMADLSQAILNLQKQDPRPIALAGDEGLRRIVIDDIRAELTRPIFYQDKWASAPSELASKVDEAFLERISNQSPFDIGKMIESAILENRCLTELPAIFHAATMGRVQCLVVTSDSPNWNLAGLNDTESNAQHESTESDRLEDSLIDDTVEQVLRQNGSVIFASKSDLRGHQSETCAIVFPPVHTDLTN
jgi:hypothetical protein